MKKSILVLFVAVSLALGCQSDDSGSSNDPEPNAVRLVSDSAFGEILTDSEGRTLYYYSKDTKTTSECLDGCREAWPIFFANNLTLDAGLNASDFGTITRPDGPQQTTYMGWPLYYFASDINPGDTNGDQVNDIWYIAKPDYSIMFVLSQLTGHDGNNYRGDYTLGNGDTFYITDIMGRTMYTFSGDSNNTNTFTAPDFSNNDIWPIVALDLDKVPSILNNNEFGFINIFGRTQLTFRGWPLYYFGQDIVRGDNKGISFPTPGVWPIANVSTEIAP